MRMRFQYFVEKTELRNKIGIKNSNQCHHCGNFQDWKFLETVVLLMKDTCVARICNQFQHCTNFRIKIYLSSVT